MRNLAQLHPVCAYKSLKTFRLHQFFSASAWALPLASLFFIFLHISLTCTVRWMHFLFYIPASRIRLYVHTCMHTYMGILIHACIRTYIWCPSIITFKAVTLAIKLLNSLAWKVFSCTKYCASLHTRSKQNCE